MTCLEPISSQWRVQLPREDFEEEELIEEEGSCARAGAAPRDSDAAVKRQMGEDLVSTGPVAKKMDDAFDGTLSRIEQFQASSKTQGVSRETFSRMKEKIRKTELPSPNHEENHLVLKGFIHYSEFVGHQIYQLPTLPGLRRVVPLQFLGGVAQNVNSKTPLRDGAIDAGVEMGTVVAGSRAVGGVPTAVVMMLSDLVALPLLKKMPSLEEMGRSLGSSDFATRTRAEQQMQTYAALKILALPSTFTHAVGRTIKQICDSPDAKISLVPGTMMSDFASNYQSD